ncbi:MAG TPA: PQQ-binding-like beta-propeller repeat protein, partial [Gemmatales bacterium]|nr:PQQ-binding-like beta-propeller repeat protein [Gemmatales bacterium]
MMHYARAVLLGVAGVSLLSLTQAEDWPGFRGPGGNGLADGKSIPLEWNQEKNILWKVKVPGVAWSSPIVVGDKIFISTAITENQRKPGGGGGARAGGSGGNRPPAKGGGNPGGQGGGRNPQPPNATYQWELHCLDKHNGKTLWKQTALEAKPRIPTH